MASTAFTRKATETVEAVEVIEATEILRPGKSESYRLFI